MTNVKPMTAPQQIPKEVDVLGIGFGPSNIAVAIAQEEMGTTLDWHFIEAAGQPGWQPEMLLAGSDIQNNPIRDLVSPRNPRSKYSFTNYLKCEDRLLDYLNLGLQYPFRVDFASYVCWVADQFSDIVSYDCPAIDIAFQSDSMHWKVETKDQVFLARALIVGSGRSRNIPTVFQKTLGPRVFHLSDFLKNIEALSKNLTKVAVVGSSQSAVEIHNDLLARDNDLEVHAIHRSFSMRQKDTSPFSDLVYFPEFIDYFYNAPEAARTNLQSQLRQTNYSSADLDVLHQLYTRIYEEKLLGRDRFRLHKCTTVEHVAATGQDVTLELYETVLGQLSEITVDAVVLATGFRDIGTREQDELFPPLLSNIAHSLRRNESEALCVERDYRVHSTTGLPLYLNGLCESSHGMGDAGSFSLISFRAIEILQSVTESLEKLPESFSGTDIGAAKTQRVQRSKIC